MPDDDYDGPTSPDDFATGSIQSRRDTVGVDLSRHYRNYWDCRHIADVESDRAELTATRDRSPAQLLECADIDTIIDTMDKQIAVQEKIITSPSGDSLALKTENNHSDAAPEARRLKESVEDRTILRPTILALADASGGSVSWVRFIDTEAFVTAWLDGGLSPRVWTGGPDANTKLFFAPDDIDDCGATVYHWSE